MTRHHWLAFWTLAMTVVPAIPAAAFIWVFAFMALTGWDRHTLNALETVVFVLGFLLVIGVGAMLGAVAWLRLMRKRLPPDIAWYWLTRGTPPVAVAHRINRYLFTRGWGNPPPDAV